ncbi:DUF746 domain-containing protein [Ralstonia pseudosolanacearum]|uniref:DUF746 domain-containing protein n=1 Tax=Ralstonia pseudosolanacearum TaxID=1310165 RepID=UPI001FFBFDC7|nr:DUF746 domain-containing protein [Ralstonia pseudosolanacearum]
MEPQQEQLAQQLDVTVAETPARESGDEQTEDQELTEFLTRAWTELVNPMPLPALRCPRCGGLHTRGGRAEDGELAKFLCRGCKLRFDRLTGTPFAKLRVPARGAAIIPLLSRRMSIEHAVKQLGWGRHAVTAWLLAFRCWLLELDPTGRWEARVRLGVRVAPVARCRGCGFEGAFKPSPGARGRRRIQCPECGHSRQRAVLQMEGQALEGVVTHDVIDTALQRRRKAVADASVLPVVHTPRTVALTTHTRQLRRLADVVLPDRPQRAGLPSQCEDVELSAFLGRHIDAIFSTSAMPDPCPWCGSPHAECQATPKQGRLPGFRCRTCRAYFTRASNTPLVHAVGREHVWRLLPMLGWHASGDAAARAFGMSTSALHDWLRDWRRWLLLLDPSGAMEAKVWLGLHTEDVEPSEEARAESGRRWHISAPTELTERAKPAHASEADPTVKPVTLWATSRRKTPEVPLPGGWFVWSQKRAAQRAKWIFRPWKRSANGDARLRADGFVTRVVGGADGWCFEVRAIGATEIRHADGGYASSEAARLAAFDAITAMLGRVGPSAIAYAGNSTVLGSFDNQ